MANIRKWLEESVASHGETLQAIVVGVHDRRRYTDEEGPKPDENRVLSPDEGLVKLDEEFDAGYGGADCYPMYAWTERAVYFIHEYDGSTGLNRIPRAPEDIAPEFSGGV